MKIIFAILAFIAADSGVCNGRLVPQILYSTSSGVQAFDIARSHCNTHVILHGQIQAIAHDPRRQLTYFATNRGRSLLRTADEGREKVWLLNGTRHRIWELEVDVITGIVYLAMGHDIYACATKNLSFYCAKIVKSGHSVALNPSARTMYWSSHNRIRQSDLDGTNSSQIKPLPKNIHRIIADVNTSTSKLFYISQVDKDSHSVDILSAEMNGQDSHVIVQKAAPSSLLLVASNRIYWAESKTLKSAKLNGENVKTFSCPASKIVAWTLISQDFVQDKTNPCKGDECSHICVLTFHGLRCLCPDGMKLGPDEKTCK